MRENPRRAFARAKGLGDLLIGELPLQLEQDHLLSFGRELRKRRTNPVREPRGLKNLIGPRRSVGCPLGLFSRDPPPGPTEQGPGAPTHDAGEKRPQRAWLSQAP